MPMSGTEGPAIDRLAGARESGGYSLSQTETLHSQLVATTSSR
jgi:hypothetical protein